jgi:hypothetical protein
MTIPAPLGDRPLQAAAGPRPPMPSIAASALLESRRLISQTRQAVSAWLTGAWLR